MSDGEEGIRWSVVPEVVPIEDSEVHLWRAVLDVKDKALREYSDLLAEDERKKAARFKFEIHRNRFVATRAVLRILLSEYLRISPREVVVRVGEHGKPELGGERSNLQFNLSHSGGIAVLAFTEGRRVGVDIEDMARQVEFRNLAARFFSKHEQEVLGDLPDRNVRDAFYECWTRKEAYIKALGLGVTHGLDNFAVAFGPDAVPALLYSDVDDEAPERWGVRSFFPAAGFAGALVAEGQPWVVRGFDVPDGFWGV